MPIIKRSGEILLKFCLEVIMLVATIIFSQRRKIGTIGTVHRASQVVLVAENLPAKARGESTWFDPWSTKRQPTPIFLPGESHGQRSLVGRKELDTTEVT